MVWCAIAIANFFQLLIEAGQLYAMSIDLKKSFVQKQGKTQQKEHFGEEVEPPCDVVLKKFSAECVIMSCATASVIMLISKVMEIYEYGRPNTL